MNYRGLRGQFPRAVSSQGKVGAGLFIVDANVAFFVERHLLVQRRVILRPRANVSGTRGASRAAGGSIGEVDWLSMRWKSYQAMVSAIMKRP